MDIKSLHKEGHSIKAIARHTGRSRNTVRRVLREPTPAPFHKPERHSQIDPYKAYLRERWESCGLSAVRLWPEIQAMGYNGSIVTLRRYLHSLKPERERMRKLTVRFETPPGKQAQADWAYCGRFPDPAGHVSIHAPAWGATPLCVSLSCRSLFQSTRPHGARRGRELYLQSAM